MASMSRWLVAGVLLGCWGCAFSLDGPSPNRPRNRVPVCDTSKGLVALDGVMASALGVATLSIAAQEPAAALIPLGLGALYLGGAVAGNRAVDKCRAAIADYEGNYSEERYSAGDDDEDPLRSSKTARADRPRVPYTEQPEYARPQSYPPRAYPPQRPPQQPSVPQPPVAEPEQPPVRQVPAPQPAPSKPPPPKRAPVPAESNGDWSDFWREVP